MAVRQLPLSYGYSLCAPLCVVQHGGSRSDVRAASFRLLKAGGWLRGGIILALAANEPPYARTFSLMHASRSRCMHRSLSTRMRPLSLASAAPRSWTRGSARRRSRRPRAMTSVTTSCTRARWSGLASEPWRCRGLQRVHAKRGARRGETPPAAHVVDKQRVLGGCCGVLRCLRS